ncbi:hypothetical protein RND71_039768 [Anisodus tanguticus]|uniref:Uncharacterized protein n=1 Tax=Anisodus tanguticus TaxID=243964 RepID=A0AAE1R073_9SOLA|nr:hypothetical protein RND71_039768 [Anisodus tanguticus]
MNRICWLRIAREFIDNDFEKGDNLAPNIRRCGKSRCEKRKNHQKTTIVHGGFYIKTPWFWQTDHKLRTEVEADKVPWKEVDFEKEGVSCRFKLPILCSRRSLSSSAAPRGA